MSRCEDNLLLEPCGWCGHSPESWNEDGQLIIQCPQCDQRMWIGAAPQAASELTMSWNAQQRRVRMRHEALSEC